MSRNKQSGSERQRLVKDADVLLIRAEAAECLAGISHTLGVSWRNVAKTFEEAAGLYQQAGLGLAARAAYEDAREAFTKSGRKRDAERCKGLADAIPVYYEEEI